MIRALALAIVAAAVAACTAPVDGTPTWPGARLERAVLTADDFPTGVQYDRIEDPSAPGGPGGPPSMLSAPKGCADGLTRVIAASAERGPGSAIRYALAYDGARILVTVLSWPLDLTALAAEADRCATFQTFFDPSTPGIPMRTEPMAAARSDTLAYRQTMQLGGEESSVYFWFGNVGAAAVFAVAFPSPNPTVGATATLPQTLMEVAAAQADRLGST